ncbi:MFS transporter [Leekyejoonella antrihumi]|uniref:MFS transporter n=1 Tax=Leekyejoonella antrihumi TaxID=1660198 RepID=A0A563DWK2_9MICO|nr:MFS transporter [Leekyejoonella antrihumi]TWP34303.1 MFS transporter [Leekyejoonella antrihumi]
MNVPKIEVGADSLWRHRNFRRFWSAQGVSELGDRVTELALPLIAVILLDASPTQVGVLTAVVWLPNLASLFIGAWVEQHRHKRRLMIAADLFRAAALLSIPVTYWAGALTMPQLYAVAMLTGVGDVVFSTAYPSFFAHLVTERQYLQANSKLSTTRSGSFIAGPAIAGVLVQVLSAPITICLDAASFCFSALQVNRVTSTDAEPDVGDTSLIRRARAGVSYVVRHPYLRDSLGCATTMNFFNFIGATLLVLFANRILGLSAGIIGVAFGIGASGGAVGAMCIGRLTRRFGVGRVIAFGALVFPSAIAIAAAAQGQLWVRAMALAIAEFVGGFAVMCFDIPHNSLRTIVTPDSMRSRVAGGYSTINYGIRPVGAVVGGLLADWIGVRATLLVSATGGILALQWLIRSPILRLLDLGDVQSPRATAAAAEH